MKKNSIICLCGSSAFKDAFLEVGKNLSLSGHIVLTPLCFSKADGFKPSPEQGNNLVEAHNKKIEMCDSILVINKDGYIGNSTKSEIDYGKSLGKPIEYLEPV